MTLKIDVEPDAQDQLSIDGDGAPGTRAAQYADVPDAGEPRRLAFRLRLFVQRFWQPTSACLTCMPGHVGNVISALHWEIALRTGLLTGALVLLLSFTRFVRIFRHRAGNAVAVGVLTVIGDASAHPDHYGQGFVEPVVTGVVSGSCAYVAAWLLEDRARRLREAWRRVTGG